MSRSNPRTLLIRIEKWSFGTLGFLLGFVFALLWYTIDPPEVAPRPPAQVEEKETDMYEYQAEVIRVVDADTIWCRVDLGFRLFREISLRFEGINAPELSTQEGKDARDRLKEILFPGDDIIVRTYRDPGAWDRYTAVVIQNGTNINEWLVEEGLAVPYIYKG